MFLDSHPTSINDREKHLFRKKVVHLTLGMDNSLCDVERSYEGHRILKMVPVEGLAELTGARPLGDNYRGGVCCKCWKKLRAIIEEPAEKAARQAVELHAPKRRARNTGSGGKALFLEGIGASTNDR